MQSEVCNVQSISDSRRVWASHGMSIDGRRKRRRGQPARHRAHPDRAPRSGRRQAAGGSRLQRERRPGRERHLAHRDGALQRRARRRTGGVDPGHRAHHHLEEQSHTATSPDRLPHEIPEPSQAKVAAFTRLTAVAAAIDKEAGIRFARPHTDGEVAYSASTCPSSFFSTSVSQCCRDGDFMYVKPGDNKLWVRAINSQGGAPCRTITSQTGCSTEGTACWFGPCGVNSQVAANPNTTSATVFFPTSAPTQCGRDSNGTATGGGVEAPEAYNGTQTVYAGVAKGCPYSACKSDGTPGTALTLDAECILSSGGTAGSGSITWNGNTVTCDFATHPSVSHTYYFPYNTSGTITSSGGQWWVGWSGGAAPGPARAARTRSPTPRR
jgi:hypothetical protein